MDYDYEYPEDTTTPHSRNRGRRWRSTLAGRGLLTLLTVGAVASLGMVASQATFSDQVTMAQISVTGGTLDMQANNGDGPNQAWAGSLAVAVTGMKPGDEQSGTVEIKHAATSDVPFRVSATVGGTDAAGCFTWYFRETAAVGATKAASTPVNFPGMGTAAGADATMVGFTSSATAVQLADDGADLDWETDDAKTYTLTVRMNSSCTTNGAAGTLDFTFDAIQA